MINRVILIVADSLGIGNAPDADKYGDSGANTLGNIAKYSQILCIPNLIKLGLGKLLSASIKTQNTSIRLNHLPEDIEIIASYGRAIEVSAGKDTTTGHWEIAGLAVNIPFPTYPQGFPQDILKKFEERTGKKTLGNKAASGIDIIAEFGVEHMKTGNPIVYTSADSVFQIAAHEAIIKPIQLYEICEIARQILTGKDAVARVIARPFKGNPGNFERTENRKDFSLKPFNNTLLDNIKESGLEVIAIGKIEDIFAGQGITKAFHTHDNMDGIDRIIRCMRAGYKGLIFTNLVDFDMKYGHRRDVEGYAKALNEFDKRIPELFMRMGGKDVLIITADHGNDPTAAGFDYTRETVPILVYGKMIKKGYNMETFSTMSDIGASTSRNAGR